MSKLLDVRLKLLAHTASCTQQFVSRECEPGGDIHSVVGLLNAAAEQLDAYVATTVRDILLQGISFETVLEVAKALVDPLA